MILPVICEICSEKIAMVETEKLSLPITGMMFKSPDSVHGYPEPFHPMLTWEPMRCPYGPHRPFTVEGEIMVLQDGQKVKFKIQEILPEGAQRGKDSAEMALFHPSPLYEHFSKLEEVKSILVEPRAECPEGSILILNNDNLKISEQLKKRRGRPPMKSNALSKILEDEHEP